MSSRARRADLIGHGSATGAQRFPVLGGRILGGLMLHLGVDLTAHEDNDGGQPHPDHESDHRTQVAAFMEVAVPFLRATV
jgi:hypothetical protein